MMRARSNRLGHASQRQTLHATLLKRVRHKQHPNYYYCSQDAAIAAASAYGCGPLPAKRLARAPKCDSSRLLAETALVEGRTWPPRSKLGSADPSVQLRLGTLLGRPPQYASVR